MTTERDAAIEAADEIAAALESARRMAMALHEMAKGVADPETVESHRKSVEKFAAAILAYDQHRGKQEPVGWLYEVNGLTTYEDGPEHPSVYATYTNARPVYASPQPADVEALREEAAFLLDRLDDFERDCIGHDKDTERQYAGHVHPSVSRLRNLVSSSGGAGQ